MQPYFFPHIGYFQLIKAVNVFVIYDDVNFIKQGWINRNKILISGRDFLFTLPLKDASSFTTIKETQVSYPAYIKWKNKFLKSLEQSYKNAAYFDDSYKLIESVLNKNCISIADFAKESIIEISNYLGLKTSFQCSSINFADTRLLDRESRLISIIKKNDANIYINSIGGQSLYEKDSFAQHGIQLKFIKSKPVQYKQFKNEFVPFLSIIDVLMFNGPDEINNLLDQFELI